MRTLITVSERLLAQIRRRAVESGASVSRFVEQAVRLFIRQPAPVKRHERFELVTFGAGGRFSRRDVGKTSALIEEDDLERFGRQR